MTTDLTRTRLERGEVVRVERFGTLVEVTAMLPHLAATSEPGQFAQLRCGSGPVPLLRRPFSVAWIEGELCTFVFEEVGTGTRLLGQLQPGDELEVLGPLGTAYTLAREGDRCLIVSGGVGCAPFPLLVRRLLERGVRDTIVLSGATSAMRLYPANRFRRGAAIEVREATYDGSRGIAGRVTDLMPDVTDIAGRAIYACGPNRMLAAVWEIVDTGGMNGRVMEASLEAPMGCGFGTCLGCALPVRSEGGETRWALCCSDGPVMPMAGVDWDGVTRLPGADVA